MVATTLQRASLMCRREVVRTADFVLDYQIVGRFAVLYDVGIKQCPDAEYGPVDRGGYPGGETV